MVHAEIDSALKFLKKQKIILYPTDTVWGIGCDATSEDAVTKVYTIKQRISSKSMIILVNGIEMLKNYVDNIPNLVLEYLKHTKSPTTVIYKKPKKLAKNVVANDNTVAIRVVKEGFAYELITKFNKPIVSTSANRSKKPTPINFKGIDKSILSKVDYVVSLPEEKSIKPSTIISFNDGKIEVIRD